MVNEQQTPVLVKPGRRRLWNILLALVIFVSGLGIGSGLTIKFMANTIKRSLQPPQVLAEKITQRMQRRLDLTDEQAMRVRRILRENLTALRAMRQEYRPRVVAQLEKTRRELETVLTPEQSLKMQRRFHYFLRFWFDPESNGKPSGPGD